MSKPDTWKSWEGLVIKGKFPLRQWLGGSDHSAVFLTEFADQHAQRAAIKLIQVDEGNAETRLSRLRATAKLSHPHLIRTFESGLCRLDGSPFVYVLMECADDDLSRILPERPLDPSEVSDLLPPVLDALSYLHKNGFVHGRVKPSNVLAAGDQLKLSSDQVAPVVQQDGGRRRRDVYDAPETAAGIISPAGDIWSAGVTLLAALAQNVTAAEQASPANRDLPETIPDPFRGIVRECLQLDPNRRCSLKEIQARMQPVAHLRSRRRSPLIRQPAGRYLRRQPRLSLCWAWYWQCCIPVQTNLHNRRLTRRSRWYPNPRLPRQPPPLSRRSPRCRLEYQVERSSARCFPTFPAARKTLSGAPSRWSYGYKWILPEKSLQQN
jgi:serine/threonine-protein kinase Stk1